MTQTPRRALTGFSSRTRKALFVLLIAGGLYALDQWTKHLAVQNLDPANPPSYLGGFLKFILVRNSGAAFSLGTSMTVVLTIFAIIMFGVVLFYVLPRVATKWHTFLASLALAGILGNLTDRMLRPPAPFRGHVIDFVALPNFAIFNVADMCITGTAIGVIATVLLDMKKQRRDEPEHAEPETEPESEPADKKPVDEEQVS